MTIMPPIVKTIFQIMILFNSNTYKDSGDFVFYTCTICGVKYTVNWLTRKTQLKVEEHSKKT